MVDDSSTKSRHKGGLIAPDPRVPAVRRQAHKLQHHLMVCREKRAGQPASTHAASHGEDKATPPQGGARIAVYPPPGALDRARRLAQDLGPLPKQQARTPQSLIRGGREHPPCKGLVVQG